MRLKLGLFDQFLDKNRFVENLILHILMLNIVYISNYFNNYGLIYTIFSIKMYRIKFSTNLYLLYEKNNNSFYFLLR